MSAFDGRGRRRLSVDQDPDPNIPQNAQDGDYTLVFADAGRHIYKSSGGTVTWTIPANSSVPFPRGTVISFVNDTAVSVSLVITSDSMFLAADGGAGPFTIPAHGSATILKVADTRWMVFGAGVL